MKPINQILLWLSLLVFANACVQANRGRMPGSNLDRIVQHGVLRVGTAADMPPLTMLNKSGVPMGMDVDLAGHMAEAMGVELRMVVKSFIDLLPALEAGELDVVISGMVITPERNLQAAFAGPYHFSGQALLTKFKSLVISGDTSTFNSEAYAFTALENSTAATLVETMLPRARLVTVKDHEAAVALVLTDKVDALIADYHVCVLALLRHRDAGLVSLITPFTYEPLGIAMPAGDAQMINWVSNFLDIMRESGELIKLKVKWIEDPSWLADQK